MCQSQPESSSKEMCVPTRQSDLPNFQSSFFHLFSKRLFQKKAFYDKYKNSWRLVKCNYEFKYTSETKVNINGLLGQHFLSV